MKENLSMFHGGAELCLNFLKAIKLPYFEVYNQKKN